MARAKLIKLGTEDGIKIHGITYPCNVDSVEILALFGRGEETTELINIGGGKSKVRHRFCCSMKS
ncbi:hypothetical protein D3C87_2112590 [compost metagenome]